MENGLLIWMVEWITRFDEDWLVQHHVEKIVSQKGKANGICPGLDVVVRELDDA